MAPPTIFFAKRVYYRSEDDPLQKAMAIAGGWKVAPKAESATIVWDIQTLADTISGSEPIPGQMVNHVPAMLHCCRKAVFANLLARLRALLPPDSPLDDGKYLPMQWALPLQASALDTAVQARAAEAKRKGKPAPIYIVKPDGGSMGDGILLTPEPCKPSWNGSVERVVQEYIGSPLLLDGLKFDLRLYVLLTSTNPVRAHLYREGLARFAVDSYVAPSRENLRNVNMHLTNYSLNKKSENFKSNDEADGGDDGSKRTASSVFAALYAARKIPDVGALWDEIGSLVGRSLAALHPVLSTARTEQKCFQILGFDVLLDSKCRPWLVEINDHRNLCSASNPHASNPLGRMPRAHEIPALLLPSAVAAYAAICTI